MCVVVVHTIWDLRDEMLQLTKVAEVSVTRSVGKDPDLNGDWRDRQTERERGIICSSTIKREGMRMVYLLQGGVRGEGMTIMIFCP